MRIDKKQFTLHGYNRVKQRTDFKITKNTNLSASAVKYGLNFNDIPPGPLKSYVGWKRARGGKRIKLYKGYVFVFFLNSKRLLTCYPIPEKHLAEYNQIIKKTKEC